MKLRMFIANNLIDSLPVDFKKLPEPGYIDGLKARLEEKHASLLKETTESVQFFIEHVPSSMGRSMNGQ
jgi:hypothetical protein